MELSRDLLLVNRYFRQKRQAYLEPFGLKGYHARYLIEIGANPGISQDQLAQKLQVDKSNIARQVAFLEENGYLQRQPSPTDKRVQQLFATEKAQELMLPLKAETDRWEQQLFGVLDQEELQTFGALLARLRVAAENGEEEQ